MDLNNPDFVLPKALLLKDDFSRPNMLNILKSREMGTGRVQHLKNVAELKTSVSKFEKVNCNLPTISSYLMAYSHDSSRVAIHADNSIYVCDIMTGQVIQELAGHCTAPSCLRFHPCSNTILASGSIDGEVRVWNFPEASKSWVNVKRKAITSVAFHPLEQILIIASGSTLYFWNWSQPGPATSCSTNSEVEKISFVECDMIGRIITVIKNDYSREGDFRCVHCACFCPTNDDGSQWHKILKRKKRNVKTPSGLCAQESAAGQSSQVDAGASHPLHIVHNKVNFDTLSFDHTYAAAPESFESDYGNLSSSGESLDSNDQEEDIFLIIQRLVNWSRRAKMVYKGETSHSQQSTSTSNPEEGVRNSFGSNPIRRLPHHRIQCFEISKAGLPAIHDPEDSLVVKNSAVLSDKDFDVSQDGEKLVVLLDHEEYNCGIFSLKKNSLGTLLCIWGHIDNANCVSFSPLSNFVVVGTACPGRDHKYPSKKTVAHMMKIDCVRGRYKAKCIRKFVLTMREAADENLTLYNIRWLRHCELGLVYLTAAGHLIICKPVAGTIL